MLKIYQPFCYGKVLKNPDKDHPNQVRVQLITLYELEKNEVWANISVPYGGESYGMYFLPEIGEYVLLAMTAGESPVIISSILGKQTVPQQCKDDTANEKKSLCTKGGNEIFIQDTSEKAVIQLKTASGYTIKISDESKTITITDSNNKNFVEINGSKGSVDIKADKNFSVSIGGTEVLKINSNSTELKSGSITIEGSQKLTGKGGQLQLCGTTAEMKADADLTIKSSGIAQVSGSMLKLNG